MRNKWKLRAISWILSVMMIVTSVGLDSFAVKAAESNTSGEEWVAIPEAEGLEEELDAPQMESEAVEEAQSADASTTGITASAVSTDNAFTYKADFSASYITADMTFTLEKIGENAPAGSNNVDLYIKPSAMDDSKYQQFEWYEGLDSNNQVVISGIQYNWQSLTPGVRYDIKIVLRHDNTIIGEAVTSFTTKAVSITHEEKLVTWFSAEYQLNVADKEQLKKEGITELKVYPYIREKDGEPVRANVGGDGIDILKDNLTMTGLKEDTEYEVFVAGASVGKMNTGMSGKLNLSVELAEAGEVEVKVVEV